MIARASTQTDQARARWAAEYREARKVRRFDERFALDAGLSSLYETVSADAYLVAVHAGMLRLPMMFARRNGRYGINGRTKRVMFGPRVRLPA